MKWLELRCLSNKTLTSSVSFHENDDFSKDHTFFFSFCSSSCGYLAKKGTWRQLQDNCYINKVIIYLRERSTFRGNYCRPVAWCIMIKLWTGSRKQPLKIIRHQVLDKRKDYTRTVAMHRYLGLLNLAKQWEAFF